PRGCEAASGWIGVDTHPRAAIVPPSFTAQRVHEGQSRRRRGPAPETALARGARTMPDTTTTVQELRQAMAAFVRERDWEQFHSPKNLVMGLSVEAAELMEHFLW